MDLRDQLQRTLGDAYTIERELGGGGMSRVFLATERALGRKVVIKVLPEEAAGALSVERFKREIALAARLQQANIVPLLAAGDMNGLPFFTMPYVEGESLRARLTAGGELPIVEAVGILKEVARALAYAHEHGVVHRDIKPDNVLLSGGTAMVTDFGVAKALSAATTAGGGGGVTATGIALGTPAYMSPEQAAADPGVDHRADIYAFGCLAYEVLTGSPPFAGRRAQAMAAAHATEAPDSVERRRPAVSPPLAALVMRCLEKRPADRPQRASEIVHALDEAASGPRSASGLLPARRRRGPAIAAVTVVALILIALAAVLLMRNVRGSQPRSVAVLPFENVGGDSTQEYFSDGMGDDIASALVNDGLRVAPRASSTFYKGKPTRPQEVGSTLGVDAVLTGKVSRLGSRLRVSVELVSAREGVVLWSYSDNRDAKDIFGVQHAITDSIVGLLKARIRGTVARSAPRRAENAEAHDLVMQGRYFLNQSTRESLLRSIDLFNQALARDSLDTGAWVGLALSWEEFADGFAPPSEVIPRSVAAVERALALDSTLADAWSTRAILDAQYERDWPRVRREVDKALSLNPNDVAARWTEMFYRIASGDQGGRAVELAREAARLDPLSIYAVYYLQWMYYFTGQPDSAMAQAAVLDRLLPGFAYQDGWAGYALADLRRFAESEQAFRRAEPVLGHRSPGLAWLLAQRGRTTEARAILAEIERDWKVKYVVPEFIAGAYLALGDKERAYRWLEKGIEVQSAPSLWDGTWQYFRPLKDEPRFRKILERAHVQAAFAP